MWLPKDERKLLRCYYSKADGAGEFDVDLSKLEIALCKNEKQVMNILKSVGKRGLITRCHKNRNSGYMEVDLTQEAIHLGRKYSSKIGTLGVWFTEYMWLWVVLSVIISLIGVIVTILIA